MPGNSARVLLAAYWFPPIQSGTQRCQALARAFQKTFDEVHVLSTSNRSLLAREGQPPEGVRVWVLPTLDYRTLRALWARGRTHSGEGGKLRFAGRILLRLLDSLPLNPLLGTGGLLYILCGVWKGSQLVRSRGITHLFSSYRPLSDHLIAAALKRLHPHLRWVADFRDLPVDPVLRNVFLPGLHHAFLRRLLRGAEHLTTVSQGLVEHLKRYHPRVRVVYNGLEARPPAPPPFPKFTIAYTGSLFRRHRDPTPFLQALETLLHEGRLEAASVQFLHAGKDGEAWLRWLQPYPTLRSLFRDLGLLPRAEALSLQQKAHVNLLLTYTAPHLKGNLTGKFWEYAAAGRPLLALVNGCPDEELEEWTAGLAAGQVFYAREGPEPIARWLEERYREWVGGNFGMNERHSIPIDGLTWKQQARKIWMKPQAMG